MKSIRISAPAKINLSLDINGTRADGYHNVEMIMQSIALHDVIEITKIPRGIELASSSEKLPDGKENLAYRAAELILRENNINKGVAIYIDKNIPLAAGLAGGSTDAAAVLNGINILFDLDLDYYLLQELASRIGMDVVFCLRGGTVLATERGDNLSQLPDIKRQDLILVKPPISVSTARIYQEYDRLQPEVNVPTRALVEAIKSKDKLDWNQGWKNVLQPVTEKMVTDVREIINLLKNFNLNFITMSGSGPTIYAILDNYQKGDCIINDWSRERDFLATTHTLKSFSSLNNILHK